jgi:cation:H+ antiporter
MNTLLILGVTALILPMAITPSNWKRDIPMNILTTILLIFLGLEYTILHIGTNGLSRWDGGILIAFFIGYMILSFKGNQPDEEDSPAKQRSIWMCLLLIVAGIAGLAFGGNLFVNNATELARALGVSDKFIAITILAGGTSMPELATCVVAAAKKKGQLALGNIIGSNVFNILLILGGSALISPLSFDHITYVDLGVLLVSALVLLTAGFVGRKKMIDRLEQGKPLVAAVSAGDFTDSGHFIVIADYRDGSFVVNDPNSLELSAKRWTFEQLSGQIRVMWAFSRTGEG